MSERDLVEALKAGLFTDVSAVDHALSWAGFGSDLQAAEEILLTSAQAAIDATAAQVASVFDFAESVASLPERAGRIASEIGAQLVTDITENTRKAIQEIATDAVAHGETWEQAARRIKEVVGLDSRRAASLNAYITEVQDELKPNGEPLTADQVQRRIDKRYKELVADRAETIAKNEIWMAVQEGQVQAWKGAQAKGFAVEGLDLPFVSRDGKSYPSIPIHVSCRCSQRLRRQVDQDGGVYYAREFITAPQCCPLCATLNGVLAKPS